MTQQPNTGSRTEDQPAKVTGALSGVSEDSPLSALNSSPAANDNLELIEENRTLREQVSQLQKRLTKSSRKEKQAQELGLYQAELIRLQQCLERRGKKMVIAIEGRGAAGKGGMIRRITQYMNAKHYRVVALGKPTEEERSQWFYQRYIKEFPRAGEMVMFDRSWYTRALIEPVFNFCSDRESEDFFKGVSGFEMDLVNQDIILIKLYLSVSREEQARRFEQRKDNPLLHWKLNEVDLDAEEHREEFTDAKYKMLRHTHTVHAPWRIIRSDIKHQARLNVMKVILSAVDYERLDPTLDITPDPTIAVSGAFELERMEAQRFRQGKF